MSEQVAVMFNDSAWPPEHTAAGKSDFAGQIQCGPVVIESDKLIDFAFIECAHPTSDPLFVVGARIVQQFIQINREGCGDTIQCADAKAASAFT